MKAKAKMPVAVLRRAAKDGAVRCSWACFSGEISFTDPKGPPKVETSSVVFFWDDEYRQVGWWTAAEPTRLLPASGQPAITEMVAECHQFAELPGVKDRRPEPADLFTPFILRHEERMLGTVRAKMAASARVRLMGFVARRRAAGMSRAEIWARVRREFIGRAECPCGFCAESQAAVTARTFDLIPAGEFAAD